MTLAFVSRGTTFTSGALFGFCVQEAVMRACADKKIGGLGASGQKIRSLASPLIGNLLLLTISTLVGTFFSSMFVEGFKCGILFSIACRNQAAWSQRPGEMMPDLGCSPEALRPINFEGRLISVPRPPGSGVLTTVALTTSIVGSYYLAPQPLPASLLTALMAGVSAKLLDAVEHKAAVAALEKQRRAT